MYRRRTGAIGFSVPLLDGLPPLQCYNKRHNDHGKNLYCALMIPLDKLHSDMGTLSPSTPARRVFRGGSRIPIRYDGLYWNLEIFLEMCHHRSKVQCCASWKQLPIFPDESPSRACWFAKVMLCNSHFDITLGVTPSCKHLHLINLHLIK